MPEGIDNPERDLSRSEIEQLIDAGIIRPDHREIVLGSHRKSIDWKTWVELWTATIGVVFLLSGVIFFFAWNWKELSPTVRFGVLESGVVLATVGALIMGIRHHIGQRLLVAASVFTGVLVAVYGQVYQTGADAFEVFMLWSLLMTGWVVVSRFAPLWLLWLTVVQTAVALWFGQVAIASGEVTLTALYVTLGAISAGVAILREWLGSFDRFAWLRGEWLRVTLVAVALIWLSMIAFEFIFDFRWRNYEAPASLGIGLLLWFGAAVGGGFFYTRVRPSLTSVGLCILAFSLVVVTWFGKEIIDVGDEGAFSWLLAALVALGVFSGAATLIAKAARVIKGAEEPEQEEAS